MKTSKIVFLFSFFIFLTTTSFAQAHPIPKDHIITFEDYVSPTDRFDRYPRLTSSGFNFYVSDEFLIGDNENTPDSGSTSILIDGGLPFGMMSVDGNPFNLRSFRVAEGRNMPGPFQSYGSTGLEVIGITFGGERLSTYFSMDQLASNNAATDFQLFVLHGFDNLSYVGFIQNGYAISIDDIDVQTIFLPEPANIALVGFGLLSLQAARRRSH